MYSVSEVESLCDYEKKDIVETFRKSGLHGETWPKTVYAIVTCKVDNTKRGFSSQNTFNGPHAETKMVTFLREKVRDGSLSSNQSITLYVNYSPCHDCSRDIGSLVVTQLRAHSVRLEVVVACLYKIGRPSCRSCFTHRMPNKQDHDRNVEGLIGLQIVGVVVRTINGQDWNTLIQQVLEVDGFIYNGSTRQEEDWKMKSDLQTVLIEGEIISSF